MQTLFPAFSCPAEGLCGTNVVCDPVLLEELLFNLLKNAAEAASDTGSSKARAAVTVSGDTLVFTLTNPVADADEAFTAAQGPAAAKPAKKAAAARDSLSCGAFWRPAEDASH